MITDTIRGGNILKPPCEIIVNKMLPHVRADIARILVKEYRMKQIEVSKRLGITQASVSQYLSSTRGSDDAFNTMFPEMREYAKAVAEKIASGENREGQIALLCELCTYIRGKESFCSYHRVISDMDDCELCFNENANDDE